MAVSALTVPKQPEVGFALRQGSLLRFPFVSAFVRVVSLVIAFLLLMGCAGAGNKQIYLSQDAAAKLKKIGVVTSLEPKEFQVIDIAEVRKNMSGRTYGGYMFGAIGAAVEGIILEAGANMKIRRMVGGDPIRIVENIGSFDPKAEFDANFFDEIHQQARTVEIPHFLGLTGKEAELASNVDQETRAFKGRGVDAVLIVVFQHGIGAYTMGKPVAVILADVLLYNAEDGHIILKRKIEESSSCSDCTVEDYAANGAQLYKNYFAEISRQISRDVLIYMNP